jgi:hypothetical protein
VPIKERPPYDGSYATLPYREDAAVDKVVGKKRAAVQIGTAFWDWPLWRRYPLRAMLLGTSTAP